jgi:hypothetical protein
MSEFWEKYKDPRWQRKRLEVMERAGFKCQHCEGTSKTLNVHHTYYERGADPWDYPDDALKCLCEDCHEATETAKRLLLRSIGDLPPNEIDYLRGIAVGINSGYDMKLQQIPERTPDLTPEDVLADENYDFTRGFSDFWGLTHQVVLDYLERAKTYNGWDGKLSYRLFVNYDNKSGYEVAKECPQST